MRKFFTFLLCVVFVSTLTAQEEREAWTEKASVAPIIGGEIDEVWAEAEANNIDLIYQAANGLENPTVGEEGETYWKGLWTDAGVYLLVYVADDDYYPYYERADQSRTGNAHAFDNIEIFFDCNFIKEDGNGGRTTPNVGHYQLAPAHADAVSTDPEAHTGVKRTYTNGSFTYDYSINATNDPHYFYELFIPWSSLKDKDGNLGDASYGFGFEVAVADNDNPGTQDDRNRMVWSNNLNGDNDSWANMDDAGMIYFTGYEEIYVAEILLTGGDITEDNQTLQIEIELVSEQPPLPPTDTRINWIISEESTGAATISSTGLVTPKLDGTFIVQAVSADGFVESDWLTINISNQKLTIDEVNLIVDGYFDNPQENGRPDAAWATTTWNGYGTHTAYVEGGVLYFNSDSVLAETYSMKMVQSLQGDVTFENKDVEYVASWKMWATEVDTFQLATENSQDWSVWAVASPIHTPNAVPIAEGAGRWDIYVSQEPQWYSVRFTAGNMTDDSNANPYFGWQVGHLGLNTVYVDSLYVITVADSLLIDWKVSADRDRMAQTTLNVYPNPANDILNVSLTGVSSKTRIAIYNSVGLKMEEVEVVGNHHAFDVSKYASGLYFVKSNDQVVKFVR